MCIRDRAKIDSLQILIGEQAKVQLQVAMDAKQHAIFPAYTDTLVKGVEIIETVKPDTQFLNDRQRMLITQEYVITCLLYTSIPKRRELMLRKRTKTLSRKKLNKPDLMS